VFDSILRISTLDQVCIRVPSIFPYGLTLVPVRHSHASPRDRPDQTAHYHTVGGGGLSAWPLRVRSHSTLWPPELHALHLLRVILSRLLSQQFRKELPRHRPAGVLSFQSFVSGNVDSDIILPTTRSLHIPSHSSPTAHPTIRRYDTSATDNKVTDATKTNRQQIE